MYYYTPVKENICYKGILRCFSILLGKKISVPFFPSNFHRRNFPARKIKLVGFPASCKVSSQQAEERQFCTSYVENGRGKGVKFNLQWGGGGDFISKISQRSDPPFSAVEGGQLIFLTFHTKLCFTCYKTSSIPRRILQQEYISQPAPAHRNTYNLPSQQDSSGEQIKWGTDSLGAPGSCFAWSL